MREFQDSSNENESICESFETPLSFKPFFDTSLGEVKLKANSNNTSSQHESEIKILIANSYILGSLKVALHGI